jgi:hypothetical protein
VKTSGSCAGGDFVSIIRVGLAETRNFAEGWDAIFGDKKKAPAKKTKTAKASAARKKSGKTRKKSAAPKKA